MKFKIEKGVPFPSTTGRYSDWPFGEMKVGDSFQFGKGLILKVRTAASWYGKRHEGFYFSCRKNENGYRCWRVEKE